MSIEIGPLLIAVGVVLVLVGMAMLAAARLRVPAVTSSTRSMQERARSHFPRALAWTSVGCGVITGMQWTVLSQTDSATVWVAVLSLPDFLAAATVTRVLAVWRPLPRLRRARTIGPGRRYHR